MVQLKFCCVLVDLKTKKNKNFGWDEFRFSESQLGHAEREVTLDSVA